MGLFYCLLTEVFMTKTTDSKRRRDMAIGIVIGHLMGDKINILNSNLANDEAHWITTKSKDRRRQ